MAKEYIERKAAEDLFQRWVADCEIDGLKDGADYFRDAIDGIGLLPATDVAPVVHGKWIKPVPGDGDPYCSHCKAGQPWFYEYGYYEPEYCPNCGAKMDLEGIPHVE